MQRFLRRQLRFWLRSFWGAVLLVIVSLAVMVQLGRAVFPLLDDYRPQIEAALSEQLGVAVHIARVDAEWTGLRPRISLDQVQVLADDGTAIFAIDQARLEVSLLATLLDWRLAFRRLQFAGLHATLVQDSDGSWWVQGLPEAQSQTDPQRDLAINDPLDIFLFGRRVELRETYLTLIFRGGLVAEVAIPQIRLENDSDFHRLAASFAVDQGHQAVTLVVEAYGDPRDNLGFDAHGYMQLRHLPSEKVLAALGVASDHLRPAPGDLPPADWQEQGKIDLELWFQGTARQGLEWRGRFAVQGAPLLPPEGATWPDSAQADFRGSWHPLRGWQLLLQHAQLQWPDHSSPQLTLQARGHLGEPTHLALAELDLGTWSSALLDSGWLTEGLQDTLSRLQPQGTLRDVQVTLLPSEQGYFDLRAELDQVSVEPWHGAPGIEGISGYLQADAWQGHVLLDRQGHFAMQFPFLYHRPLAFTQARGSVRWAVDLASQSVGVSSGRLQLADEEVAAQGYFHLHLPFDDSSAEPTMTLLIGVERGAASLHRTLVPFVVPDGLYSWLDSSIQEGVVSNAGFIYHGSLAANSQTRLALQLSARVNDAVLQFDPSWPPLEQASAILVLDDEELTVDDVTGRLMGLDISGAQVQLAHLPDGSRGIAVQGQISGTSTQAQHLVRNSPLRDFIGAELESWQVSGAVSATVDLEIPLQSDSSHGHQRVSLTFHDNRVVMPDLNLAFEQVSGPLEYRNDTGIRSTGLRGRLWQRPVTAQLRTQIDDGAWTGLAIDVGGSVDLPRLQQWTQRPELGLATGRIRVNGQLWVPFGEQPLALTLQSDLQGATLALPAPYGKAAEDSLAAKLDITIGANRQTYRTSFADLADLLVVRDESSLAVALALGGGHLHLVPGEFWVRGHVSQFEPMVWLPVLDAYLEQIASMNIADSGEDMPLHLDLQVAQLQLHDWQLPDAVVTGLGLGSHWRIQVQQDALVGNLDWRPDAPAKLDLSRLHLPAAASQTAQPPGDETSFWQTLDFAAVPAVDLSVDELKIGEQNWGRWSSRLRGSEQALFVYDLQGDGLGMQVSGRGKPGAEFYWMRGTGADISYFAGELRARDLGVVLSNLGVERMLTSERAFFDLDLQWTGNPADISLAGLRGVLDLNLERGRFIRGAQAGENPLVKLLGLLNFDTLTRRLRLDFSDLHPEGLGYEKARGRLLFSDGTIRIPEPLQVETPSSHLQLQGELDAREQTLEAQLVATLPLTGNLTVAAAVTGGVPLAVGVYLVGKVFKRQMDRASSIRYQLQGPWADPQAKMDRVFDNRLDALRRQETAADLTETQTDD